MSDSNRDELHLRVYRHRSELVRPDGGKDVFLEGAQSAGASVRQKAIVEVLKGGFLEAQIIMCRDQPGQLVSSQLSEAHRQLLDQVVEAVTSEVGRAIVGLLVLQLGIKAIAPQQSIRLHKARRGSIRNNAHARDEANADQFSWAEGISMRSLDREYITPTLRAHGLVKLNKDGFMMTRSLAENYPYSGVYKAAIRGARQQWLHLIEAIETGQINPLAALQQLLSALLNKTTEFTRLAEDTLAQLKRIQDASLLRDHESVVALMKRHMQETDYSARIMEISMHTLMQALQEVGGLDDATVVPLSQMRSANKKHGNVGDVELMEDGNIIEAWDAKFGETYLRDELEELNDKLGLHEAITKVGFVTSTEPEYLDKMAKRISEIEDLHQVRVSILSFDQWIDQQFARTDVGVEELPARWLLAYTESLAQRRQDIAPIDEPCFAWLSELRDLLTEISPARKGL